VRRRESRGRLPAAIAESVRAELARLGAPAAGCAGDVASSWAEAVGPTIAANAWPARVARDGTLVVHTSSSVWAFELAQMEQAIRERLAPLAPPKLSFVVGPLPEPGPESVPKVQGVAHRPGPPEREKAAEIARAIGDPELRQAVARAIAAGLARRSGGSGATGPSDRLSEV
jgi:hypothetical protein